MIECEKCDHKSVDRKEYPCNTCHFEETKKMEYTMNQTQNKASNHRCKEFPKGYTAIKIEFFKEAISGWNWNLVFQDGEYPNIFDCYHIKFCPFCGIKLEE